jgi:hypothetical protein
MAGFNRFKQEHSSFLNGIRKNVGAHREKDALAQLEVLEALDHMAVYRLGAKFSEPLRLLVDFQIKLLEYVKHPGILLSEAMKAAQANPV